MCLYKRDDIIRLVEEEDVEFIRLQFTDIEGTLKNMAVTASQLDKVLNNRCTFDGSSITGFHSEESEFLLYPELDTFTIFPWRPQQGKVARLICDIYNMDGTPFECDSRYILKKVVKEAKDSGFTFNVGPECEFFLFDTDEAGQPTTFSHERGSYFDLGPVDMGENARREMVLTLEQMGFEIESSHHEAAPAQHEIDFKYDNALKTADNMMTFQMVVRTVARRHGLHATFMPKPKQEVNGSGMHINMSLLKGSNNIFYDSDDKLGLSREARSFIAGLMDHMPGMAAVMNPLVNSYKRLVPGYEAPVDITWSARNKNVLIRTAGHTKDVRLELRSPDSAANPYLAFALCLASGLDGMKRKLVPEEGSRKRLPENLKSAMAELEQDTFLRQVMGEPFYTQYCRIKKEEWENYCSAVSQWEIENYLYRI